MIAFKVDDLFERAIFPGFPFRNRDWLAIAFERNSYDNTRLPEWFFRSASQHFNADGQNKLLIKGDCFALSEQIAEVVAVDFDWDSYRNFMLSPESYSLEYKMASKDRSCGCWADAELTIFGGSPEEMTAVLADFGGADAVLARVEREFFLDERDGNEDLRAYFRGLLFPEHRR